MHKSVFMKFAGGAPAAAGLAGAHTASGEPRMFFKQIEIRAPGGNDLGERQFQFIASDETADSYGDIVRAAGWDLKRYKKNPIVLFNHNSDVPVGFSPKTWVEGTKLMSIIQLADEGTSDFIDTLYKLVKQRILRAMSVGFQPTADVNIMRDKENNFMGLEFNGQELLENSVVSVPANPNALAQAKALGARDSTLNRLTEQDALVQNSIRQRKLDLLRLGVSSSK